MVTIVVPLDGSEFAERALRPACAFAARLEDARVLMLSCAPGDDGKVQDRLHDRAELFAPAADVDSRIIDDAEPAEGILRTVASTPDALLLMATHGRGGLRPALLGSVTERVLRRSSGPLVLVGPACHSVLLDRERGRMLVCSDGSTFSEAITPVAASWGARLRLDPWVAEVVVPDEEVALPGQPVRNRQVEEASARLEELARHVETPASPASTEVLHGTPPSRSLIAFAEQLPASLVAMATHGRTGLTKTVMGSVTTEVVRHAPCPVLVTRPRTDGA